LDDAKKALEAAKKEHQPFEAKVAEAKTPYTPLKEDADKAAAADKVAQAALEKAEKAKTDNEKAVEAYKTSVPAAKDAITTAE